MASFESNIVASLNGSTYVRGYDGRHHGDARGYVSPLHVYVRVHHGYETPPHVHARVHASRWYGNTFGLHLLFL